MIWISCDMTYLMKLLGFFYKKSIILKRSKELQHGNTIRYITGAVATFCLPQIQTNSNFTNSNLCLIKYLSEVYSAFILLVLFCLFFLWFWLPDDLLKHWQFQLWNFYKFITAELFFFFLKSNQKSFTFSRINCFNLKYLQQVFAEQAYFISASAVLILIELQKLLKVRFMFICPNFFMHLNIHLISNLLQ